MRNFLFVMLTILAAGCTYSFRGQTAGDIKSIAIPTFENETTEFGFGERITEELISGFQRDGILRITTEDQADAILRGRIISVEDKPYTARSETQNLTVEEYRFSMSCEIELVDRETDEPIWSQVFPAWAVYAYTGSLENRDQAVEEAVDKLLEDLLNKIVGSW